MYSVAADIVVALSAQIISYPEEAGNPYNFCRLRRWLYNYNIIKSTEVQTLGVIRIQL